MTEEPKAKLILRNVFTESGAAGVSASAEKASGTALFYSGDTDTSVDLYRLVEFCDDAVGCTDPLQAIRNLRDMMVRVGIKRPPAPPLFCARKETPKTVEVDLSVLLQWCDDALKAADPLTDIYLLRQAVKNGISDLNG